MDTKHTLTVSISIALAATGATFLHGSAHASERYEVIVPIPSRVTVKHQVHHRPVHHIRATDPRSIPDELWFNPLAGTIWGEARNQPLDGRRAVGHVVMNRVKADRDAWGHGIIGVCHKRKQFSWLNISDPGLAAFKVMLTKPMTDPERIAWEQSKVLAKRIASGQDHDNTHGATTYRTNNIHAYWDYSMTVVGVMYDHTFFRDKTPAEWKSYRADQRANARLKKNRRIARKANRHHHKVQHTMKHKVSIKPHHHHASKPVRVTHHTRAR